MKTVSCCRNCCTRNTQVKRLYCLLFSIVASAFRLGYGTWREIFFVRLNLLSHFSVLCSSYYELGQQSLTGSASAFFLWPAQSIGALFSIIIDLGVEESKKSPCSKFLCTLWTITVLFSRPSFNTMLLFQACSQGFSFLPSPTKKEKPWERGCYCLFCVFIGYESKGRQVKLSSPVDQLLHISQMLVTNVEKTLRAIVQEAIKNSLSKFPTLKQAVETKVVNKIFNMKREQTIQFIQQFLEMQKKSIDVVFTPVPTPAEINHWESVRLKDGGKHHDHPCMTSETMIHMKDLAQKLYPPQLVNEIEGHGNSSAHTSFLNSKVSIQRQLVNYL